MEDGPQSGMQGYEERWREVGAREVAWREQLGILRDLQGDWKVERLSGLLPMPFMWKRVRGGRGETYVLPPARRGPGLPFKVEQREGRAVLIYRPPLSFLVDELRLEGDSTWLGRATAAGILYAWFEMLPM